MGVDKCAWVHVHVVSMHAWMYMSIKIIIYIHISVVKKLYIHMLRICTLYYIHSSELIYIYIYIYIYMYVWNLYIIMHP